jgi:hypothetical protein
VDAQGIIQEGHVMEGDLLAIHHGAVGAAPGPLVALNMGKVIIDPLEIHRKPIGKP